MENKHNKYKISTERLWSGWTEEFYIKELLLMLLSQKCTKKTHPYPIDRILEQTPDLDIYPNGTMRWFAPLILEEDLVIMEGPSANPAGEMISFRGIFFTIHFALPLPGFFLDT